MKTILFIILSYLVGGIPSGYIIFKIFKNDDIRKYGSGNIGFANVLRTAGPVIGFSVLILDAGKAFLATYYFSTFFPNESLYRLIFGLCTILGNVFNPFLRFKGGKGVGTALGVTSAINPIALVFALPIFIIVLFSTKYVSVSSMSAVGTYMVVTIIFYFTEIISKLEKDIYPLIFSVILFLIVILRHISNIKRLIKGEEIKIAIKKTH